MGAITRFFRDLWLMLCGKPLLGDAEERAAALRDFEMMNEPGRFIRSLADHD
jgi:hypothetical protein